MTLHGVVPGASVTVPVVTAELRVRGHTFRLQVAVSELGGRTEVLVGIDVIERLWAAGVRMLDALPNGNALTTPPKGHSIETRFGHDSARHDYQKTVQNWRLLAQLAPSRLTMIETRLRHD